MEFQLLQTCFGVYIVLAVPAFILIWTTLVMAKKSDERIQEQNS